MSQIPFRQPLSRHLPDSPPPSMRSVISLKLWRSSMPSAEPLVVDSQQSRWLRLVNNVQLLLSLPKRQSTNALDLLVDISDELVVAAKLANPSRRALLAIMISPLLF